MPDDLVGWLLTTPVMGCTVRLMQVVRADPISHAEAEDLTDRIRQSRADLEVALENFKQLVLEAYHRKADEVLGYDNWEHYVETEFSQLPRWTKTDRKQLERQLKDAGMTTREIAKTVGVSQKTVSNDTTLSKTTQPAFRVIEGSWTGDTGPPPAVSDSPAEVPRGYPTIPPEDSVASLGSCSTQDDVQWPVSDNSAAHMAWPVVDCNGTPYTTEFLGYLSLQLERLKLMCNPNHDCREVYYSVDGDTEWCGCHGYTLTGSERDEAWAIVNEMKRVLEGS